MTTFQFHTDTHRYELGPHSTGLFHYSVALCVVTYPIPPTNLTIFGQLIVLCTTKKNWNFLAVDSRFLLGSVCWDRAKHMSISQIVHPGSDRVTRPCETLYRVSSHVFITITFLDNQVYNSWAQVTHVCVNKQSHHWLRYWLSLDWNPGDKFQ